MQSESDEEVGKSMDRRSFFNYFLGLSFVTFGGFSAYAFVRYLFPPEAVGSAAQSGVERLALSELPVGSARIIRYKGEPSIVVRVSEKSARALSAVCTHLGCIVKWDSVKGMLVCPCHAAMFDTNGNVLGGPAPRPLASYPVNIVRDEIIIGEA